MGRTLLVAATAAWVFGGAATLRASDADWLTDDGNVLELKLAHLDKNGPDGGILRIDRGKKVVSWDGIPGEIGCKLKVEATFDDVKSVSLDDYQAGFVVELKKGKTKKLVLIPVPHAMALMTRADVKEVGLQTSMANAGLRDSAGDGIRTGGSVGGAGPAAKKVELPKEVVADTRKAADAVLEALGRAKP